MINSKNSQILADVSRVEIDSKAAFESIFEKILAEAYVDHELVVKLGFDSAKTNREIKFKAYNVDDVYFCISIKFCLNLLCKN